ncbi:HAD-IIIA family hydrolase [Micromonospora soli]|uniref:HAD-IIIA family hydrolase n=1 Tax=Micromonospora sp. NBRC 110009 TaxID=3061627 RepID=UPI0026713F28|nr:HAD-IIIA family hydrolase [Micromonospora sp. NBRC 110009]WKT99128.1 HAD-IIIA family hydrolase [Micromonospora sp. NBRC 110009]
MFTSLARGNCSAMTPPGPALYDAVLLDRDGTLIEDVPYNGDPEKVRPVPGAREALDRLRAAGLRLAVVTNQSGLARGCFTERQMRAVHARVEELLGPFDHWAVCPHDDGDRCACRKPAPGLVHAAARALGTVPRRCVLVGDIGRDMAAALAAGATGLLVPTPVTRGEEVAEAPAVARDLAAAVDEILRRTRAVRPVVPRARRAGTVLVVRSDSAGDVLVTGPGIRAVAAGAERVVLLCGPRGRAAAELLPGVDEIIEWPLPWIDGSPAPVDPADMRALTDRLAAVGAAEAVIFTSFHQSPLPLALLLRMAGVARISAISDDYPGSLLDVRHRVPVGVPEPERAVSLAAAAGFALPAEDEPALRLRADLGRPGPAGTGGRAASGTEAVPAGPGPELPAGAYVVVHPGSSAPARACPAQRCAEIVAALAADGHRVVVTGGPGERELTARVAAAGGTDLGGSTDLAGLARIIAGARCLVVGNTGPAHLAAAVGTPVVSLFAPTVPFGQWGPYRVPTVRLGDAGAACRDTRAAVCPVAGHPCLTGVDPAQVVAAVRLLTPG